MKWLKYLLILSIGGCDPMAISVPNTNTFNLQNVIDAVEYHAGEITDTLDDCFNHAKQSFFDPEYNNSEYAPANSMKRFRNYGPYNSDMEIFVPSGFSPDGDGVHDYFEVYNLEYYPIHRMSIFDRFGKLLYRRTNDYHLYPWDGTYNGEDVPIGTYQWVLEINGEVYDQGTVQVMRYGGTIIV